MKAAPTIAAVGDIQAQDDRLGHVILFCPRGRLLNEMAAVDLARHERLILLCGRFGGFEPLVTDVLPPDELSVGDYVLNGGEVAAMVVIDTVIRHVPDVLRKRSASVSRPIPLGTVVIGGR